MTEKRIKKDWWEALLLVVLFWYPLRHIQLGIDFWDTGYNYGNFAYMGTEHMDSMWLFSTYIANCVGHVMTWLPGGDCLVGMNLYTGMTVSVLALMGYWFCTRKLEIPKWISFIGEMLAISLCWCPTALLYNYLTYIFFTGCVICLYIGLKEEKKWFLFAAGSFLGINVLVRFSNLPEMAMILSVWFYGGLVEWESSRAENRQSDKKEAKKWVSKAWSRIVRYTGWCLAGYAAALAVLFGYIHIRYGIGSYVAGIGRLFAMTDKATDYKATSMVAQLVYTYIDNLYWIVRLMFIAVVGFIGFLLVGRVEKGKKTTILGNVAKVCWCGAIGCMIWWLYYRGFCSLEYDNYGSVLRPGISFLTLILGFAGIRILQPSVQKEEKMFASMMILVVLLTSIGSNNGVYPSLNHLFLAAPYALWLCYQFVSCEKIGLKKGADVISEATYPVKTVLVALILLLLVQSSLFGWRFVFAEATGAKGFDATVNNNEVLKGIRMSGERAEWLEELTAFVKDQNLNGEEILLFGNIPSMSYYLEMPAAFNSWSDLDSYNIVVLKQELMKLEEDYAANGCKTALLMDQMYFQYMENGVKALEDAGFSEKTIEKIEKNADKISAYKEFAEKLNYDIIYQNDKFVMLK